MFPDPLYPRADRYTGDRSREARNRPAESAAHRHLPKLAWIGLILGTFFAAAAAIDTEIAIFVLAGAVAVSCGWFVIIRDRRQDHARLPAAGTPVAPRSPGRPGVG